MARFDLFARADSGLGYLLDCQADLLAHLNTRLVVPVLPVDDAPKPARGLNPLFEIDGTAHVMVTQFAAAVLVTELGGRVVSLAERDTEIGSALDLLISGV
ncbi:MAG: CcdB family protein [Sandaracinobacter sp.]